jgi:NAD(P)-dependent dehydrogenase (short-subunit alcohol dehydrogenase family)
VTRAVLPVLRRQGAGHLVVMSSGGGFTVPGPGFGTYCASKFAVEALGGALRHEVSGLGIRVTLVEPGSFRTDVLEAGSVVAAQQEIADYEPVVGPSRRATTSSSGTQVGDPVKAAAVIVDVVDSGTDLFRLPLGDDAVAVLESELADVAADLRRVRELGRDTAHD